jgi:uncharacterized membrane protein YdjX (TVP38/TMEM64 family)
MFRKLFGRAPSNDDRQNAPIKKSKAAIILSIISFTLVVFTVIGILLIKKYFSDENIFKNFVDENYFLGAIIFILICSVQVVVAFIPGELLEIAGGYAFGWLWGAIFCLIGIILGSSIVIFLVNRYGRKLVEAFYPREKIDSIKILKNKTRRNTLVALVFLIPGTPKDFLTYLIGLTDMSIPLYLALTSISRLPSIIISTTGGHALQNDNYISALWILTASVIISAIGLLIYKSINDKKN